MSSNSTDQARDVTGTQRPTGRRHLDEDDADDLEDTADPETRGDESSQSIREWASENKKTALLYSTILAPSLAVIGLLVVTFVPGLVTHPLVQQGALVLGLIGLGYAIGWRRIKSSLSRTAWLVEHRPGGVTVWLFEEWDRDNRTGTPVKGFSLLSGLRDPYTVADMGDQYAQHAEQFGGDPDDPVTVQYIRGVTSQSETWFGTVVSTVTTGHRPARGRATADIVAQPPHTGHDTSVEELSDAIKERDQKLSEKNERIRALKEERDQYKAQAKQRREDIVEEVREDILIGVDASDRRRNRRSGDSSNGVDGLPDSWTEESDA